MNSNIFAACGALAIAGITLSASQTPSTSQPGTPSSAQGKGGTVTVTGCLMPYAGSATTSMGTTGGTATAGTSGTAGTAGAMAGAGGMQYVLTNVEPMGNMANRTGSAGTVAPGTTPQTPGTTTPTPGTMAHPENAAHGRYLLKAEGSSVNLSQHVNHKVEITGRMASMEPAHGMTGAAGTATTGTASTGSATTGTATTGTATTGTGTMGSTGRSAGAMDTPPTLTVTALKMIAATCK